MPSKLPAKMLSLGVGRMKIKKMIGTLRTMAALPHGKMTRTRTRTGLRMAEKDA